MVINARSEGFSLLVAIERWSSLRGECVGVLIEYMAPQQGLARPQGGDGAQHPSLLAWDGGLLHKLGVLASEPDSVRHLVAANGSAWARSRARWPASHPQA